MSEGSGKGIKAVSKHRAGSSCDSSFHRCLNGIWIKDLAPRRCILILVSPVSSLAQSDSVLFQPGKT